MRRHAGRQATEVGYHYSPRFPAVLEEAGCSLLVSTYQAGQLVAVGVADGELALSFRGFDRVMGVAVGADRIAVAGKGQIWSLDDHSELAAAIEPAGRYDRCWLPRSSTVTGEIQCHEMAWGTRTAASRTSGSSTPSSPAWPARPPLQLRAALAAAVRHRAGAEDRCHLNGLAMRDGSPAFVTVWPHATNRVGGARPQRQRRRARRRPGEAVTTGLAMPHSPRWHEGSLFVLDSGMGQLERVDLATGSREAIAAVPGYTRGLALHGGLAFVGLSKIRETATFGGVPIAAYHDQLKCGVGVVELSTGNTVATLQFDNGVEEIFDVQAVPGVRCPTFGGSPSDGDEVWLLPSPPDSATSASGQGV